MEDNTHYKRTYCHDSYILFLVLTNVGLNRPSERMLEFPVPLFLNCFSVAVSMGSGFLYMVHFLSTFNPYFLQHSTTNNNPCSNP